MTKLNEMMQELTAKKEEVRSLITDNKVTEAENKMAEVRELEKKVKLQKELDEAEERDADKKMENRKDAGEDKKIDNKQLTAEERTFVDYIRRHAGMPVETREGEQNLDMTNNGAVIPTTIAKKVISKVKELCPILEKATTFKVKGTLKVPVWAAAGSGEDQDITVGFQSEFTDITANSGKFASVDLSGFLAGALILVGKSVINNADIDVLDFITNEMAKKIAEFLDNKLLNGQTNYNTGALATSTTIKAGSISAISADNLIDLQAKIPTAYQSNACWTMNPATFTALKKIKDGNGQYLLQSDFSGAMPYRILGKPVYLSDNMPTIASAAKAIVYGDLSGIGVNFRENISIQVLTEKYATQHAVGIISWFEFDSNVIDNQKLATLVMSTN